MKTYKTKHTPGPWQTEKKADGNVEILDEDGFVLAEFFGEDGDPDCWPVTANATLAKASPDMLEALEGLEPYFDHIPGGIGAEIDAAREAIAKARGRS